MFHKILNKCNSDNLNLVHHVSNSHIKCKYNTIYKFKITESRNHRKKEL